jgi:hypothetical protein
MDAGDRDPGRVASRLRDSGVLLGYCSRDYYRTVRCGTGETFRRVGELVDPLGEPADEAPRKAYDPGEDLPLGMYDPLARELYTHPQLEQLREAGRHDDAEAVIEHEAVHVSQANEEWHIYDRAREDSFYTSLVLLRRGASASDLVQEMLINGGKLLINSELAQEGIATTHDGSLGAVGGAEAGDGSPVDGTHSMANWLRTEWFPRHWEVDPFMLAFGMTAPGGEPVPPDRVLRIATTLDPAELAECDAPKQVELLTETVLDRQDIGGVRLTAPGRAGLTTEAPPVDAVSRRTAFDTLQTSRLEELVDNGQYWAIPVSAREYPGVPDGCTLWDLLDSLFVTEVDGARRLFLPESSQWATDTRVLELALSLWALRERTYIRLFRALRRGVQYDPDRLGSLATELQDAGRTDPSSVDGLLDTSSADKWMWDTSAISMKTDIEQLEDQYVPLLRELDRLGRAILDGDEDTIREYHV